jgi:phi13 family phage major tail protein
MPETTKNKVEYGLRNVHYAVITESANGAISYETPVALPGAVSLSLDKSGDMIRFKADDVDYYTAPNNQGYEGNLTLARVPDEFRQNVLGEEKTSDGVMIESADAKTKRIALMFEFQGDVKATRHVFYYCAVDRPSVSSTTKDSGDPNTVELPIVASPRPDNNLVKAKTTEDAADGIYDGWYEKVYEKSTTPGA